jgi:endonuclease/exonuclease/phosphatase family metal-dependent hydrolase
MPVLLTWNVAGRVGRNQERQIAALAERPFDALCLQEITPRTRARWMQALEALGLYVAVSDWPVAATGSRRFAVLVAAREPLRRVAAPELPWSERHLAVETAGLEVHTLHAPLSSKEDLAKVRTLEALFAALANESADRPPRVLAGDLNTPRYESREGEIVTFAREPLECDYVHEWREQGLSDHSAMWARLESVARRPERLDAGIRERALDP